MFSRTICLSKFLFILKVNKTNRTNLVHFRRPPYDFSGVLFIFLSHCVCLLGSDYLNYSLYKIYPLKKINETDHQIDPNQLILLLEPKTIEKQLNEMKVDLEISQEPFVFVQP